MSELSSAQLKKSLAGRRRKVGSQKSTKRRVKLVHACVHPSIRPVNILARNARRPKKTLLLFIFIVINVSKDFSPCPKSSSAV
jgi:hypothetical protein